MSKRRENRGEVGMPSIDIKTFQFGLGTERSDGSRPPRPMFPILVFLAPPAFQRLAQFIVALIMTSTVVAQDEPPAVVAEVNPREIYEGQSLLYKVHVQNIGAVEPELSGFEDFEIEFRGDQSRNETIVLRTGNNQPTVIRRLGHEYHYQLTPTKSGKLTIPPAVVEFEGKRYKSEALTINVISAANQDIIRIELNADRAAIYRAQSLQVSLTVQVKSLPGGFADRNPVGLAAMNRGRSLFGNSGIRAPRLNIPWLDDGQLAPHFKPEKDWQSVLLPIGNNRLTGFRINDIPGTRSFLDVIDRTFLPPYEAVQLKDARGNPQEYWQFEFSRRIVGWQPGKHRMGPCTAQGSFGVDISGNSLLVQNVFAKSNAITIQVLDVPDEGRPANYINVSGKVSGFSGDVRPRKARVGDPLTLTLRIEGSGTLDEATPPNLASIPKIANNFRLLEPTGDMIDGERVFTYSLRPLSTDVTEIPPIEVTYFDPDQERFVPIQTAAIGIQVGQSQRLSANQIVATPREAPAETDIELSDDGLFGNFTNIESFRHDDIQPVRWIIGWGSLLGSYGIAWLLLGRWQRNQADPARAKRRVAMATANRQLARAQQFIMVGNTNEASAAIRETFVGLVSDVTGHSAAGMTPREVRAKLEELDVPSELAGEVSDVLDHCEASRYGAAATTLDQVKLAKRLLARLEADLNQRGMLS